MRFANGKGSVSPECCPVISMTTRSAPRGRRWAAWRPLHRLQEVFVEFHRLGVSAGKPGEVSCGGDAATGSVGQAVPGTDTPRHQIPTLGDTALLRCGQIGDTDVRKKSM